MASQEKGTGINIVVEVSAFYNIVLALIVIVLMFFWSGCTNMLQHPNLPFLNITKSYKVPKKNGYSCSENSQPNCAKLKKIELKSPSLEDPTMCLDIPLELRFDCHPGNEASQQSCEARGCCWKEELSPEMKKLHKSHEHHEQVLNPTLQFLSVFHIAFILGTVLGISFKILLPMLMGLLVFLKGKFLVDFQRMFQ